MRILIAIAAIGLLSLLFTGAIAQPTDNPVEQRYPQQYPWTSALRWSNVYPIGNYGGSGDSLTDNTNAFELACNAAFQAGGGVIYFPAGVYLFSKDIVLKSGVVLRGDAPLVTDAQSPNFRPPSKLVFPKYVPSKVGSGTPDSSAFKGIYSEFPNQDNNVGLVNLEINRAIIYLATKFGAKEYLNAQNQYIGNNKNFVFLGIRSNNAAVTGSSRATTPGLGSTVPMGQQHLWQRWPNRFIANLNIEVSENCLVAGSKFNDAPTDDFIQTGFLYRDGTALTDSNTTWFSYTDKSAIFVNTQMPDVSYWAADSAKAPWWFRPGIVIRDNWIYRTKRDGIQASGNGLHIFNNIVKDSADKPCALNPTGLTPAQGFDYNGNRSIWIRGGNNVIVENNHVTGHQQKIGNYASNDGEGIVADNQGSILNGLLIRNNDITCNWAGIYDVPLLKNILFVRNKIRRNNINSSQDLLLYSKLGGYETKNNCQTCIFDSNEIYANGGNGEIYWTIEQGSNYWITNNKYLTNSGAPNTGGIIQVVSRSLSPPYNLDTVSINEGCNQGFSRAAGIVRWLTPQTCLEAPTDSISNRIISSFIPLKGLKTNRQWLVYPNPVQGKIYLGFGMRDVLIQEVKVADVTGKFQTKLPIDSDSKTVDVSGLAAGQYIITLISSEGVKLVSRFLKE